eukprot:tig00020961_g16746.t1
MLPAALSRAPPRGVVIAAGAAVAAILFNYIRFRRKVAKTRNSMRNAAGKTLPGPDPAFIVGNLCLKRNYYKTIYTYAEQGPATLFWIGHTPFLVYNTEEGVRRALAGGDAYVKPRYVGYRSKVVSRGVESQAAIELHAQVDEAADATRKRFHLIVESKFGEITRAIDEFVGIVLEDAARGGAGRVDVHGRLQEMFVRLNTFILFEYTGETRGVAETIKRAGVEFTKRLLDPVRAWWNWPRNFLFLVDVARLIGFGRRLVRHLDDWEVAHGETTWVHAWVTRRGLSKFQYFGKVLGLVMASTQTVPLTCTWLLHLLAEHAEVRERVEAEVAAAFPGGAGPKSGQELDRLPYLDAVVKECLRLYPPFPLLQREAQLDDELEGHAIPAGTQVYVIPWLMHRHPRLWPEPHAFKPERFLGGPPPHPTAYLPFGRGPRMCVGSQLATIEMKLVAIALLRAARWASAPPRAAAPQTFPDVNMMPQPPLAFSFQPRAAPLNA